MGGNSDSELRQWNLSYVLNDTSSYSTSTVNNFKTQKNIFKNYLNLTHTKTIKINMFIDCCVIFGYTYKLHDVQIKLNSICLSAFKID